MVSWEYPPVIVGGLAATPVPAGDRLPPTATRGGGAVPPAFDTDAASHPTSDETREGVRIITAAHDPHEFEFGPDMMAGSATGHAMTRAGL